MASITAAGGLVESASEKRVSRLGGAAALAGVGAMFLAHEQHGSGEARARAERAHRRLALTLLGAAGAEAADALRAPGPWRLAWPAAALAVAVQLLAYREPPGAYE
jgi:hypothetical protein